QRLGIELGKRVENRAHQALGLWFKQVGSKQEIENFTQALYDARELAMERMETEAGTLEAEGIVAVQLHERSHGWGSHVIEFFAIGTGVLPIREDHEIPAPSLVLTLNDPLGRGAGNRLP